MNTFDRLSLVCIAHWATARLLPKNALTSLHRPCHPLSAKPTEQSCATKREVAP